MRRARTARSSTRTTASPARKSGRLPSAPGRTRTTPSPSRRPACSPDGTMIYFGGYDGVLHAVDSATGVGRWMFKLGKEARASSPAVDANGVIYVGCYDGLVYAVNPDGTLKQTWSTGNIV